MVSREVDVERTFSLLQKLAEGMNEDIIHYTYPARISADYLAAHSLTISSILTDKRTYAYFRSYWLKRVVVSVAHDFRAFDKESEWSAEKTSIKDLQHGCR